MVDNKIELRSEKVRHIIGEIPSRIVRYGITIITIVILGLLTGAYFILRLSVQGLRWQTNSKEQ